VDLGLTGHVAIVTDGPRGIGLACARGLAAESAHVVVVARDAPALGAAAEQVRAAGPASTVLPLVADTTEATNAPFAASTGTKSPFAP
jgi:NAD(P)-dependent dehydrogenase (short-subunit alcohol dehydrogenase family)